MSSSLRIFQTLNRRDFIRQAGGCSALTSVSLMSTLLSLRTTRSLAAGVGSFGENDYKAMVCVFMFGGNDGFNTLVPNDSTGYSNYKKKRSNMALEQGDLRPITDQTGRKFGLHPSLRNIHTMYNEGKVACVANVGALVRPTTLKDVENRVQLPLGLYSHSDLQQHWQTAVPQQRSGLVGWAGRVADCLTDASNSNEAVSMSFGLNQSPLMLSGQGVIPYVVGNDGATVISDYGETDLRGNIMTRGTDSLLSETYTNLLQQAHAVRRRSSIDAAINFNQATQNTSLSTNFPDTGLGRQLEMVSRVISARKTLGQKRQIFFVSIGGFDNHNELINNQARNLNTIDTAISAFYEQMGQMGLADKVTTFTASDFARTLSSNGNGTDHAWGSNHFIIGGAVKGGRVYGQYPNDLTNPEGRVNGRTTILETDGRRGRLIPTTSVDEYVAELALWFGVPNDDSLKIVLPNIENFMNLGGSAPLGIF